VILATLAVGAAIVAVAFIVRRVVLGTDDALPRQPSKLWALAFRRSAPPPDPELVEAPATPPEPERPDVAPERGSAAT
jgi:hypothetical protein